MRKKDATPVLRIGGARAIVAASGKAGVAEVAIGSGRCGVGAPHTVARLAGLRSEADLLEVSK